MSEKDAGGEQHPESEEEVEEAAETIEEAADSAPPGEADGGAAPEGVSPRDQPGDSEVEPGEESEQTPDEPEEADRVDSMLAGLIDGLETALVEDSHGQDVIVVEPSEMEVLAQRAKDAGFEMCVDVTAVDWFKSRTPRFDVVVSLVSIEHRRRLRMRVPVERENPVVPSLVGIWPGANFAEREAFDMFGIEFEGHPDLTRILMPDDWEGHPLRKDYRVGAVPVQFKGAHRVT